MSIVSLKYAEWCDDLALNFINTANVLEEYGQQTKATESVSIANKLYAEARLVRDGTIQLDDFLTRQFLTRRTIN